jgi:hypothetical protein
MVSVYHLDEQHSSSHKKKKQEKGAHMFQKIETDEVPEKKWS